MLCTSWARVIKGSRQVDCVFGDDRMQIVDGVFCGKQKPCAECNGFVISCLCEAFTNVTRFAQCDDLAHMARLKLLKTL